MRLNLEELVLGFCSAYLLIRGSQEIFRFFQRKYHHDYLPLKEALKYKKNKEVYYYHIFHYAQKLINDQRFNRGEKYLKMVLDEFPEYQLANYLYGIIHFNRGEFIEAKEYFSKEVPLSSEHPMVYFFLSKCYCHLGNYHEAYNVLQQSLTLNPYHYPSYFVGIEIFEHLQVDPKEEWEFFAKAERDQCLVKPIWEHISRLEKKFLSVAEQVEREHFYSSLEEGWIEGARLKDQIVQTVHNGQFFQAENMVIEGLRINPHDNQLYQLYDQILTIQKKFGPALKFYEEHLLRINPNPIEARLRLTDYLVFNKEYQRALEVMLGVYQHYSTAKFLHYPLCLLYNWLNQPGEALKHLAQAIYFDHNVKNIAKENPELQNLQNEDGFKNLVFPG